MAKLLINPGALRTELSLEESQPAADGLGGFSEVWVEIATVFGQIDPIIARDEFGADQTLESVSHRITVRWRGDLKSGMRFAKLARRFDILTAHDPDESRRYLVCRVKEIGL